MSRGIRLLVVIVSIALLSGIFGAWVSAQPGVQKAAPPPIVPQSSGSSQKTHVVEVLTGQWCGPCGAADPGLGRIADEWKDNLIVLMYHCCSPSDDQFWDTNVLTPRDTFYDLKFLPTMIVDGGGDYSDGTLFNIGSGGAAGTYAELQGDLTTRVDQTTNMYVRLSGDLYQDMGGTKASVDVRVTATDPVTQTNLMVRTVLYEEPLYGAQTNGPSIHRYVARAFNEQPISIVMGQTVTTTTTFVVDPQWNVNKLGVAAFVQSNDKVTITITVNGTPYNFFVSDILNAARLDFAPRGILVYRDQGTTTDYPEGYEVLLSTQDAYTFDNWNSYVPGTDTGTMDDRGLPTSAELAEFPLVIWRTGPTSANVLSSGEQTLIGNHLDSTGNLFITGSNLAFDAYNNYRAWHAQYLHGTYSGDGGSGPIRGVAGDPIGNPYSGMDLTILGGADRITPAVQPGTGAPFQFGTTSVKGSVRSQHDTESRVVYFAFEYFEGTDTRRAEVMASVIGWIDGASGPAVDVLYPDGGEKLGQGAAVTIQWHANDVLMPEDAIDLYFSSNGGMSWQQIALGEPNDGRYAWTVPNLDSAECRIRIVARDISPESGDVAAMSEQNFICGDPGFVVTFTSADLGWRLLSFPTILADTSASAVFASMSGNYRIVRAFVPTSADPWAEYDPARTAGPPLYIDNRMAFWIEVTQPGSLILQGEKPTGTQYIPLSGGWNLVGFPSYRTDYTVAMLKSDTGATRVEGFDARNIEYRLRVMADTDLLVTGQGYWVFVETGTLWMLSA